MPRTSRVIGVPTGPEVGEIDISISTLKPARFSTVSPSWTVMLWVQPKSAGTSNDISNAPAESVVTVSMTFGSVTYSRPE